VQVFVREPDLFAVAICGARCLNGLSILIASGISRSGGDTLNKIYLWLRAIQSAQRMCCLA
jgi:hypothetical protein